MSSSRNEMVEDLGSAALLRKSDESGWLVLTLDRGDRVTVDGPCVVRLVEQRGHRSRIGFFAPETTRIIREKLLTEGGQ